MRLFFKKFSFFNLNISCYNLGLLVRGFMLKIFIITVRTKKLMWSIIDNDLLLIYINSLTAVRLQFHNNFYFHNYKFNHILIHFYPVQFSNYSYLFIHIFFNFLFYFFDMIQLYSQIDFPPQTSNLKIFSLFMSYFHFLRIQYCIFSMKTYEEQIYLHLKE